MFQIYCYRCGVSKGSLDGKHCLHCGYDNSVIPAFPGNFQPAVSESVNVNPGVPALGAMPRMTDEDLSFLDEIRGGGNYQQVSDQAAAANRNLPENPNINKDNIFYKNIGRCNPAPFDPSLGSATDSHVVPEQRTYFHEQPPRNERQYIEEESKLDSAVSIEFFPDDSMSNTCPDNSFNVNRLGASQGSSNNSVVRVGKGNNLFIRNRCSENVESAKEVLEQEVHSSGEGVNNVLKKPVITSLRCEACGKLFKYESALNAHQQNNCDPNPYKCDLCDERFPYKSDLLTHHLKHTGEKPHKCDRCPYASMWKGDLKKHKDRWH